MASLSRAFYVFVNFPFDLLIFSVVIGFALYASDSRLKFTILYITICTYDRNNFSMIYDFARYPI